MTPPVPTDAETAPSSPDASRASAPSLARPLGVCATSVLVLVMVLAPLWLHLDSLRTYRLHSDDFPYVAASRTPERALANLFVAHNTHIVPLWRLLTGLVSAAAGQLANLQATLAVTACATLVIALLGVGRLVARETGRAAWGLAAMAALGGSSLLRSAATWYSAGQALWAGIGVLAMLLLLQAWRARGGVWRLILGSLAGALAGWLWTVGYAAAPVGAVYLWADGRAACRRGAALPLLLGVVAAGVALGLGAGSIDATVSFHGRTSTQAFDLLRGVGHTIHAIPETLILVNLGVAAETTTAQAALLAGMLGLAWISRRWWTGRAGPLEQAGAALVLVSYTIEWSFRGYLPFESLRGVVPWYDTIPQIGAVLFAAGWLADAGRRMPASPIARPTRGEALAVAAFLVGVLALQRPAVDAAMVDRAPALTDERRAGLTMAQQRSLALRLSGEHARRQKRHLAKLDHAEDVARAAGVGLATIRRVFGRLDAPELPDVYDACDLLALPETGRPIDPAELRVLLGESLAVEPAPTEGSDH